MDQNQYPTPEAATDEPASTFTTAGTLMPASTEVEAPPTRTGDLQGHLPEIVAPLEPRHPDTAFTETRRLRHDGWTPEKMRTFLSRLAECGVVTEACLACGISARSAYNLRDRDPLFAAGWEAACVMARARLADEAFSRSMNGVVERIYKDGEIVAERHRYDNKLTMAVLSRLDARIDRDEARDAPHLALVSHWDNYLAAIGDNRREDGMALLAPTEPESGLRLQASNNELRELCDGEETGMEEDSHTISEDDDGVWWTDYPAPANFDGEEEGKYGDFHYRRTLTPAEQAVVDADVKAERSLERATAEAQRDAYFGRSEDREADTK